MRPSLQTAWKWKNFAAKADYLLNEPLNKNNVYLWNLERSNFIGRLYEIYARLSVAYDQDNSNVELKENLDSFKNDIWNNALKIENELDKKFYESELEISKLDFHRKILVNKTEIYREENLELIARQRELRDDYEKLSQSKTIYWNNKEFNIREIHSLLSHESDRDNRKKLFELGLAKRLELKSSYDEIWKELFQLRVKISEQSEQKDYREFTWKSLGRIDYSPEDIINLCSSIENVIVPIVKEYQLRKATDINVEVLKPWDRDYFPDTASIVSPYENIHDWMKKTEKVCEIISSDFGEYFRILKKEKLLDVEARKNKSPWNYAEWLPASSRSFVFTNGSGSFSDITSLFHELGHAFHQMEMEDLSYIWQKKLPDEMSELASTTLELLACEHLSEFYTGQSTKHLAANHLTQIILELPLVAMVALFQHWAYTNPMQGKDPDECDKYWSILWARFVPGIDYSKYQTDRNLQWREILQIYAFPFYYIEYAIAYLGAIQIWNQYKNHPKKAISNFRDALKMGRSVSVQEFFKIAGAKFPEKESDLAEVKANIMENTLFV